MSNLNFNSSYYIALDNKLYQALSAISYFLLFKPLINGKIVTKSPQLTRADSLTVKDENEYISPVGFIRLRSRGGVKFPTGGKDFV